MEVARQLAAATPSAATAAKRLVDRLWRERVGEGIDAELTEQIALFAERRKAAEDDRR
jgi:hypothetical protein